MTWSVFAHGPRDTALAQLATQVTALATQSFLVATEAIIASQSVALLKLAGEAQPTTAIMTLSAFGYADVDDTGRPSHRVHLNIEIPGA